MRVRIEPAPLRSAEISVPGDKSIAHRWLILATLAQGRSELGGLPEALDVRSTASCLAALAPGTGEAHMEWGRSARPNGEVPGFTWDAPSPHPSMSPLRVEGEGWESLKDPSDPLDCGNSGTTMRLLMGVVAASQAGARFVGDESLSRRPMERVAGPLRQMRAHVRTTDGGPPVEVQGRPLAGFDEVIAVASSQVKSAILLAGLRASGRTVVRQPAQTRDHTERALAFLGADVTVEPGLITVARSDLPGFRGTAPGDPSSAAFLLVAAALAGSGLVVRGVGLNPTRTAFLNVLRRAGLSIEERVLSEEVGEPVGEIELSARTSDLRAVSVEADEFPLIADEVLVLAAVAANVETGGSSRFAGARELRVKETDRLTGIVEGIRGLGGDAEIEGDDLVVRGGGLAGGSADGRGDHRLAMALAVAATSARGGSEISGMESAAISFPGFLSTLRQLGAAVDQA
ncbi:MAG: 3-phosphoshikimate 1-carboxyvinyltransferase [Actinomycetota bacterium]|nr:3-phosphoshikimate 1-carboxyvinyltransferase [Actinomycetota bacterium]